MGGKTLLPKPEMIPTITPDILLRAYAIGVFPMAMARDDTEIHWVDPKRRGIFPLTQVKHARSLRRDIRQSVFDIRINTDFQAVVAGCADRPETWINAQIATLYDQLHRRGHAHSLEVWDGATLVGGVYGVALGAAFFGESMFSRRPNASKIALAYLIHRLCAGGYQLFDTQFLTPHLASLGAVEITRTDYKNRLATALQLTAQFDPPGYCASAGGVSSAGTSPSTAVSSTSGSARSAVSQRSTQTS